MAKKRPSAANRPTHRVRSALQHPLTRGLSIDSPRATLVRRHIILEKPFLRALYLEWYNRIVAELPAGVDGAVVEIGSGGGFFKAVLPTAITSEYLRIPLVDLICDARSLPFQNRALRGLVLIDVFHHLPCCTQFLDEAMRCLAPGGKVVMIEPWITGWSHLVYRYLHHEPVDTRTPHWSLPSGGPLSQANSALPWIVFGRDRQKFRALYPGLSLCRIDRHTPFRYLLSGGVSMRDGLPGSLFDPLGRLERNLPQLAMFATIVLECTR